MIYLPRPEGALRAHLRLLRPARSCRFSKRAIHTTRHGYALDTFVVHDPANPNASYRDVIGYIEFELKRVADRTARRSQPPTTGTHQPPPEAFSAVAGGAHLPRRQGNALHPRDRRRRPAWPARAHRLLLANANVNVASAKINTLGERAEDVFLLDGARLHDEAALLKLETVALRAAAGLMARPRRVARRLSVRASVAYHQSSVSRRPSRRETERR